ncbi:hypothetical protein ABIA33_002823 [Streptacidiphilus sp. MAP12-16]|uniref:hypothetical protein n=1 Tax=Streptacidiphilus sp. MAP12-16 TaxID=3156300 RepID=UPI00351837C3
MAQTQVAVHRRSISGRVRSLATRARILERSEVGSLIAAPDGAPPSAHAFEGVQQILLPPGPELPDGRAVARSAVREQRLPLAAIAVACLATVLAFYGFETAHGIQLVFHAAAALIGLFLPYVATVLAITRSDSRPRSRAITAAYMCASVVIGALNLALLVLLTLFGVLLMIVGGL